MSEPVKAYGNQWIKAIELAKDLEPGTAGPFYEELAASFSDPYSIRRRAMALIETLPRSEQADLFKSIAVGVDTAGGLDEYRQAKAHAEEEAAYQKAADAAIARLRAENEARKK
ncbi:hypothetical protein AGMMS50268_01930 [Spirochaetia bacterium]|nr:hypothetical protein AGMMS50268_01930 [Spirochaetia bacterium]